MPDWGYWGDPNEIQLAISKGSIIGDEYQTEKLHTHLKSYTYFIILTGAGIVTVNKKDVRVERDQVLEIAPKEQYCVKCATTKPFTWFVIGTIAGNKDKIIFD